MLITLTPLLLDARAKGVAIGSFNVYSYDTARAVLEAGASTNTPVIVAFGEKYLSNMSFGDIAAICASVARDHAIDYVLHLDHCKSLDNIEKAIAAGFSSVMIDGSNLGFADNVNLTRQAVAMAHAAGVSVEAELGSLAAGADAQEVGAGAGQVYTDAGEAADFVATTGVDALAVSIGTVHGSYKGKPDIRIDVLDAIRAVVDTPLVLHGGSGTPELTIRACIRAGITKINVNTEISQAAVAQVRTALTGPTQPHLADVDLVVQKAAMGVVVEQNTLFTNLA